LRFMRAFTYFDLVKRMGGVPLVTEQLEYDFSGDPSSIQLPRATEAEIYDFIDSELTAIANDLGNAGSQTRATRGAALALQSRAMLYAGSIARHNSEMASPITLPGGEVGIPASRATEYYQKSLTASKALIEGGSYSLYDQNPDPGENFYEIFDTKGNSEVIFAKDYLASVGSNHLFTLNVIPRSMRVDIFNNRGAGALSPSLELVENFDFLDGSSGELEGVGDATQADHNQANWIFYDNVEDIFANKDPRLYGTVIYPGTSFTGEEVDLQAGVAVWNGSSYDVVTGARASTYDDGGVLTGEDGPTSAESYTSNTGFYVRKYLSRASYARTAATQADNEWIYFRLGEIYMNAVEAAFELVQEAEALDYINTLRERAGFAPNSLTTLSRDKIRSERWAELAFEDHRIWDLKRWRIAHEVLDGVSENSWVNVLFPYRVIRPGHPDDGKFVFSTRKSARQTAPRRFQLGNYYSSIAQGTINNNPKIVRNPFH